MNSISIADEDEGGIEIQEAALNAHEIHNQSFDANLCIVGRFISEGRIEFEAMQHTLAVLWKPGRGVYIKELDSNLYLFQFYHELDVKRVLEGCPWSFNRRALVMARLKPGQNPRCIELNTMDLWVQVHDLKVGFMSESILKGVGNYIGQFVQSCPSNFAGVWREFMRIRVTIDLNKPLKRRMKLKIAGQDWFWIAFKYENVPSFCFICGIVGHTEKFCSQLFEKPIEEITKPYGVWMRAPLRKQVKPIGAKWLRNGGTGNSSGSIPGSQETRNTEDETNLYSKFTPENLQVVESGGNTGTNTVQTLNMGGNFSQPAVQTTLAISVESVRKKDTGVIETKKRRTDDGLEAENMGLNKDVLMDSDDVNETNVAQETIQTNTVTKNVFGAGAHVSARHSS